jgi:hypothetical protein
MLYFKVACHTGHHICFSTVQVPRQHSKVLELLHHIKQSCHDEATMTSSATALKLQQLCALLDDPDWGPFTRRWSLITLAADSSHHTTHLDILLEEQEDMFLPLLKLPMVLLQLAVDGSPEVQAAAAEVMQRLPSLQHYGIISGSVDEQQRVMRQVMLIRGRLMMGPGPMLRLPFVWGFLCAGWLPEELVQEVRAEPRCREQGLAGCCRGLRMAG